MHDLEGKLFLFLPNLNFQPPHQTLHLHKFFLMKFLWIALVLFISLNVQSQPASSKKANPTTQVKSAPRLVVGIVVDQMRWDFLERYKSRYGKGGFLRLKGQGFSFDNCLIPYTPTYTAAGHASIYTGSVPAMNGIIGNNWYSRALGKVVYCTDDSTVTTVGSSSKAGLMSPRNLWANTITDELRLATNFKSKVIGISLKDRGAILPAGHSANAAYWFDDASGGWITSTYYMNELPGWMKQFNDRKMPEKMMSGNWETLYPVSTYTQSSPDNNPFENNLGTEDNSFPHQLSSITTNKFGAFRTTPFANTFTFETGKAAIEEEQLGADAVTDFLALSFSTPDYIGHSFGPNSIEIEDTYLRLDKDIEDFLNYLDKRLGKNNYLVFLSADHGVAHVPGFLNEHKLPGKGVNISSIVRGLNDSLSARMNISNAITRAINYQLYLNHEAIGDKDEEVREYIIRELLRQEEVSQAFSLDEWDETPLPLKVMERVRNGYNQKLSGDIQFLLKPAFFEGGSKGTTHGTWNPYDAHIPMIFYGWNIRAGKSTQEVYMTDIAPTLAAILGIQEPNASIGEAVLK